MKTEELRIGNIVYANGVNYKVWSICGGYIELDSEPLDHHTSLVLDKIEPIPLTEEWLLKFGFVIGSLKNCYFKAWGKNGVESIVYEYHYKGGFEYELGTHTFKVIEYVHQLQNLYFALTGNELIIKDIDQRDAYYNRDKTLEHK
jgi:hypothetical protein